MLGHANSCTLCGIDSVRVEVEAQINGALKRFAMVGLPDSVLKEAKDRVRCAIENSGFAFPYGDVVINLAPASLPKSGSGFDLAIALSILAATGSVDPIALQTKFILGELALDGTVKPAKGILAAACLARDCGGVEMIVAPSCVAEALLVPGAAVQPVRSLLEAVGYLNGTFSPEPVEFPAPPERSDTVHSFGDVIGQHQAKRAMEIAAAGGHNLLMVGPPGAGKSMLAERICSILPPLEAEEQIEVTKIYAAHTDGAVVPGRMTQGARGLISHRPFRAPHHSTSTAGLIGGGASPVPGEISLAHRGVLFLDEVTELRREALEALRQPLEARAVTISRAKLRIKFPSDFILLAAMNPCPCGNRRCEGRICKCPEWAVTKYKSKISGPIADRIDLQIWVNPVPLPELHAKLPPDSTGEMRRRVLAAVARQRERICGDRYRNAQLSSRDVREFCKLDAQGQAVIELAANTQKLSARGYTRILKVARTVADLEASPQITAPHVKEAVGYRIELA